MSAKSDQEAAKVAAAAGVPNPKDPVETTGATTQEPETATAAEASAPADPEKAAKDRSTRVKAAIKEIVAGKLPEDVESYRYDINRGGGEEAYTIVFKDEL